MDVPAQWCNREAGCFQAGCHHRPTFVRIMIRMMTNILIDYHEGQMTAYGYDHDYQDFADNILPLIGVHRHLPSLVFREKLTCAPVGGCHVSH